MKTITPYTDAEARLSEIYSTGFQIAFVSPDDKACHAWVLCKDFLNDAIWASLHNKPVSIYSFHYDPKSQPGLSLDPVRLIVRDKTIKSGADFDKRIRQSIKFLNIVERLHEFPQSTAEKVNYGKTGSNVWMFTCPKQWIHAPPMISLLTLYIRIGCNYPGGGHLNAAIKFYKQELAGKADRQSSNDAGYLKQSRKMRLLIMKHKLGIFKPNMSDNYPSGVDIHTVHNNWGIVNCSKDAGMKKLWDLSDLENVGKKKITDETKEEKAEIKDA